MPLLPDARRLAEEDVIPGGSLRNLEAAVSNHPFWRSRPHRQILLADAQTNGGLLLTIEAPLANALLQALEDEGATGYVIGRVTDRDFSDGPTGVIKVV